MKNTLILITAVILLNGCTSVTNVEQTPTFGWSSVQEIDGKLFFKKGGLVGHSYLANCNHTGITIFCVEVKDGYIQSGWSLHPKRGRINTVVSGYGTIDYYDSAGLLSHTRDVIFGELGDKKPVNQDVADFQFPPEKPLAKTPESEMRMAKTTFSKLGVSCGRELTMGPSPDAPSMSASNAEIDFKKEDAPPFQFNHVTNAKTHPELDLSAQPTMPQPIPLQTVTLTNSEVKPTETTATLFTRLPPEEMTPLPDIAPRTQTPQKLAWQQRELTETTLPEEGTGNQIHTTVLVTSTDKGVEKWTQTMIPATLIVSILILLLSGLILKCLKQQKH